MEDDDDNERHAPGIRLYGSADNYSREDLVYTAEQLQKNYDSLWENNQALEASLYRKHIDEIELSKHRIAVHASSSLMLYLLGAAVIEGPLLQHPTLAAVILATNVFCWTLFNAIRRYA